MTHLASLYLAGRDWLWVAVGLVSTLAVLVLWAYRKSSSSRAGSPSIRLACALLKSLGLAALALCVLEPLWVGQRARPGANHFVILTDNSEGMTIKDAGSLQSRGEQLRQLVAPEPSGWQESLAENFEVRRYWFDSRLQSTRDFSDLTFDGRASSLHDALRRLRERFAGQPLAGILVLSDGIATDASGTTFDTSGLPPIYAVVMGSDDAIRDIAVRNVTASQTAFEDTPVSVRAEVAVAGYAGKTIVGRIYDSKGARLAEQTQDASENVGTVRFQFDLRPEKSGISILRFEVSPAEETGASEASASSLEATLANNHRMLVVDSGQGPYRILYVAGRPNWEYKFLHRALEEDDQLQMVGLMRIARREPKFEFRGRQGESSNPLFRGFGEQAREEVERYDQPVLVRLDPRDDAELRGGFPKVPEALFGYHAIIVDDLEAEFFSSDQMSLVHRFVSQRGGGLLMLGGQESFQRGGYNRTPIGDLLPVYLDRAPASPPGENLRFDLTREGFLLPWARLRSKELEETDRIASMPRFQTLNPINTVKPGASVVATAVDEKNQSFPALVFQRFGHGKSAAMMLGDLWRWGLGDKQATADRSKAWRQLVRWLVTDVPQQIQIQLGPAVGDPTRPVDVQVRVRDEKFDAVEEAAVQVRVQAILPTGTNLPPVTLAADPSLEEAGRFHVEYLPRDTGAYHVHVSVTNASGALIGTSEAGWTTDFAGAEFQSLTPNRALLASLTKATGGELVTAANLPSFVKDLPHRHSPVMETWSRPLWHQPAVLVFALLCLAAEWGLRRWKGMA